MQFVRLNLNFAVVMSNAGKIETFQQFNMHTIRFFIVISVAVTLPSVYLDSVNSSLSLEFVV